jgi:hypothetical protein
VTGIVGWLALAYAALLPVGRSGLPLNAQWGDLLLPLLALAMLRAGGLRRWWETHDRPLAAYLAVTLLASLLSPDPPAGFAHLAKQLSAALVLVVFRSLAADRPLTRRLQQAFVASMVVVTLVSAVVVFLRIPDRVPLSILGEGQVLPLFGAVRRLRGLFEAPEMLGNALLTAFLFALGLRASSSGRPREGWTGACALLLAGEFLTYSHSVAGFCAATVLFVTPRISPRASRALAWAAAGLVVLSVNAASMIDPRPAPMATHYDVGAVSLDFFGWKVEGRLMSYAALKLLASTAFAEHPLTGIGPGRFASETERAYAEGRLTGRYRGVPPHCDLAGRLAETGIFGALSLLVLWAGWVRDLRAGLHSASPMERSACAIVAGILVNSLNADVMNFRFLWLALAWMQTPAAAAEPDGFTRS